MPFKLRTKPHELHVMELLHSRIRLLHKEKQYYWGLKKGYQGEKLFDTFTDPLGGNVLVLNDLLLNVNHTTFQIDTLIISDEKIYMYEVKNVEGDYYFEENKLYKKPRLEIINPLFQIARSESLLYRLIHTLGYNLPIESHIVFINPSFILYQAPLDKPIIFPTQVQRHLHNTHQTPMKITKRCMDLAEKLVSLHEKQSPITQIRTYTYNQLTKGITCMKCLIISMSMVGQKCVCRKCGYAEKFETAVLRSIQEFKVLFPQRKITTKLVADWCNIGTKQQIRRILIKHFKKKGERRWTYFE